VLALRLEAYDGDEVIDQEYHRDDGVIEEVNAHRLMKPRHEAEVVAMEHIAVEVPRNKEGAKAHAYQCEGQVAGVVQVLRVKEQVRHSIVDRKTAHNDRKKQDPKDQEQLVPLQRDQQQLDGERVINIFKPLHIMF